MKNLHYWLYWFVTDVFLGAGLLFQPDFLYIAMLAVLIHSIHFLIWSPHIVSFPMQVRIGYLALLLVGQLPYCRWINWIQLVGTTALLTLDYCPLARMLSLMPWNRTQPLSWNYFRRAIFSMPVAGSIIQHLSPELVAKRHPELTAA